MNLLQKTQILQTLLFQLPLIIVAIYVIKRERKLIWQTLKNWWKWQWSWKDWPLERKNWLWIFGAGVVTCGTRQEMVEKNQTEVEKQMVEQKLITQTELDEKKGKEETEQSIKEKRRQPNPMPFYEHAPFF